MIPRPAQYLLRFDDLCPTMSRAGWQRFQPMIEEFGLRPILAVVPENRDPELEADEPDPKFWGRMRAFEAAGATIGLHGYRHLCTSHGPSLVPFRRGSEFAGVPGDTQRQWIRAGLEILRGHGLTPSIWVAPRHDFDKSTLRALRQEGIGLLSDGLARVPFSRGGLTWIPQQLWAPVEKSQGLWTICLHSNTAPDELAREVQAFVAQHAAQFISVDRIVAEIPASSLNLSERLYETGTWMGLRSRQSIKRLLGNGRSAG